MWKSNLAAILLIQILLLCENRNFTYANPFTGHGIRDAREREFSFVVSIGLSNKLAYVDEKHTCTGTLVSRWHVLTAAHCVRDVTQKKIQVTIGSVDLRKGRAFFAGKWITYEQWAKQKRINRKFKVDDVAIIKLIEEVNEPSIVPAKIWRGLNQELYGNKAIVAGWGQTNDVEDTSRILQVANASIPSNADCSKSKDSCSAKPTNLIIHSRYLCSKSEPYVLLGPGDSGGPLIHGTDTVVGVAYGKSPTDENLDPTLEPDCIKQRRINLYSSTTSYQDFIDDCLANF